MTCETLRLVLPDQLDDKISSLADLDRDRDVVLLAETFDEATTLMHHPRALVFRFSAMRHFAEDLRHSGIRVDYARLDDPDNSGALRSELVRAVVRHQPQRLVMTLPDHAAQVRTVGDWQAACGVAIEVREDTRFFWTRQDFLTWAGQQPHPCFADFYRLARMRSGLLMADAETPAGGRWQWGGLRSTPLELSPEDPAAIPAAYAVDPDAETRKVIRLVADHFAGHPGEAEPFWLAVTAAEARRSGDRLRRDLAQGTPPALAIAAVRLYLNAGLLDAREFCTRIQQDWRQGRLPVARAEAAIRRVLGWREYGRGLYWLRQLQHTKPHGFDAFGPVPEMFRHGQTDLVCLQHCLDQGHQAGLGNIDQRLAILGTFALVCGLSAEDLAAWERGRFADAREWNDLQALEASLLPEADESPPIPLELRLRLTDGNHIRRRWDCCRQCQYHPERMTGIGACPLTVLCWDFLSRYRARFEGRPHLARRLRQLDAMSADRRQAIHRNAEMFLSSLA